MPQLAPERVRQILAAPAFRELVSARAKMRWSLSIVTLIMFFGFLALISTARDTLGANPGGSVISVGLIIALVMIAMVVMLTGFYVQRSNSRFDKLSHALKEEFGR
jgi:uncharacterized membrane protein (DUF485 family)